MLKGLCKFIINIRKRILCACWSFKEEAKYIVRTVIYIIEVFSYVTGMQRWCLLRQVPLYTQCRSSFATEEESVVIDFIL